MKRVTSKNIQDFKKGDYYLLIPGNSRANDDDRNAWGYYKLNDKEVRIMKRLMLVSLKEPENG